jgi:hypothetical protein
MINFNKFFRSLLWLRGQVMLVVADLSKLTLECLQLEEESLFPSSCRHFQLSDFKSF